MFFWRDHTTQYVKGDHWKSSIEVNHLINLGAVGVFSGWELDRDVWMRIFLTCPLSKMRRHQSHSKSMEMMTTSPNIHRDGTNRAAWYPSDLATQPPKPLAWLLIQQLGWKFVKILSAVTKNTNKPIWYLFLLHVFLVFPLSHQPFAMVHPTNHPTNRKGSCRRIL